MSIDDLGDHLKSVEQTEAGRKACKRKPLMARLDGKAFHSFTRGLARPFDVRLSKLMIDTASFLVQQTNAKLGFVQSDEISLYWNLDLEKNPKSEYLYDGKFQKLTSILASMATAYFNKELANRIPEKNNVLANFDCRAWNVVSNHEVFLNFLWRQDDAIKNSISMAAQASFSHKQLQGVNSELKKQMLQEIGKPWEDLPMFFKMGTFIGHVQRNVELSQQQLLEIPEKYRPNGPIARNFVEDLNIGYLKNESQSALNNLFY